MKTLKIKLAGLIGALTLFTAVNSAQAQIACSRPGAQNGTCTADSALMAASGSKLKGVLLYQWVANQNHSAGQIALNNALVRLSNRYGFRLDRGGSATNDAYITPTTLQGIDVVISNQADNDPFQNSTSLTAIKNFVQIEGKAVWINHASAAYIPCPNEDLANTGCRWAMRLIRTQFWIHNPANTRARIFADTIGMGQTPERATGISAVPSPRNHGTKNPETKNIFLDLPANGGTGPTAASTIIWDGMGDEWYNYRNNPRLEGERIVDGVTFGPINILVSLDENSVTSTQCSGGTAGAACKNQGTFGDRPVAWTRKVGAGLAMHQNAGHDDIFIRARVHPAENGGVTVADSLIMKMNWRLLKYLARDFVGCMNPLYAEYRAEASVTTLTSTDDPNPCKTPVALRFVKGTAISGMKVVSGVIQIPTPQSGTYQVAVTNALGKQVYGRSAMGGANSTVDIRGLSKGTYFVRIHTPAKQVSTERIALK
jgi:hypothetical protein